MGGLLNVLQFTEKETYTRTIECLDGSRYLESVTYRSGDDLSVLPRWAQEQRQQQLANRERRFRAQQERQHRAAERVSRMQELQGQQMGSGNFVFTDRWVDGDGVSHTSTFLRTN